jgi:hypothetical protein
MGIPSSSPLSVLLSCGRNDRQAWLDAGGDLVAYGSTQAATLETKSSLTACSSRPRTRGRASPSRLVSSCDPPSPPKTCHPGHENNVKGNADNCLAPRVQRARTMAEYVRYVRHNILHDLAVSCEERARQHTTHAHSGMIVEQTTSRKSNEAGASPREDEMSRAEQDRAGQPGQRRADHGMS